MSDTVVVDGVCDLEIPIEGECGTFYKVNPTSEALTVQPTSEDVTYQPTADYFSEVTVEGIKGERTITENGDYNVLGDKQVTVAVDPPTLEPLTATANGTYTPQGDGFNAVTVNVPDPPLEALTAGANGTYTPTAYGFSEVTVDVPPDTVPLNVAANGTYTRRGGYNPVTVALPIYEGAYEVEPSAEEQTLATAGKVMVQDVVINKAESGIRLYSSKKVEVYAHYDAFTNFQQAMLPDLPLDKDFVMIDFENNTSNSRAGIFWTQVRTPQKSEVVSAGRRVGGQFGGAYGCDVYAGATINVYVGTY